MNLDPRRMIVRLAVAMMAADGRVTASEIGAAAALDRLGLGRLSDFVPEELRLAASQPIDLAETCARLTELTPRAGHVILSLLARVAASDDGISPRERAMLDEVSGLLGLTPTDADEALAAHAAPPAQRDRMPREQPSPPPAAPASPSSSDAVSRACAILGVARGASRAELDRAYRAALERYDPTRIVDLGLDFAALAVERLSQATAAYRVAVTASET